MSKVNTKSNQEIISIIANAKGYPYNGENINTFQDWKDKGFSVIRGERAWCQTRLWSKGINRRFIVYSLFTMDQVVKVVVKELLVV